jgi:hypothetical protein
MNFLGNSYPQMFTDRNVYPEKIELSPFLEKTYKQSENQQSQLKNFNNHNNNNNNFLDDFCYYR